MLAWLVQPLYYQQHMNLLEQQFPVNSGAPKSHFLSIKNLYAVKETIP